MRTYPVLPTTERPAQLIDGLAYPNGHVVVNVPVKRFMDIIVTPARTTSELSATVVALCAEVPIS